MRVVRGIVSLLGTNTALWSMLMANVVVALTGFVKDVSLASYFGTSQMADAFNIAYYLPDTLANNIIATALGVATIPLFSRMFAFDSRGAFWRLVWRATRNSLLLSGILAASLLVFQQALFHLYIGNGNLVHLVVPLFDMILPSVLLFPLTAIAGAVLQVKGRFADSALAPILLNVSLVCSIISVRVKDIQSNSGGTWVALSITLGMTIAVAAVWLLAWFRKPIAAKSPNGRDTSAARETRDMGQGMWKLFAWYALYLFMVQVVGIVERYLASRLPTGTVAALTYAYRLVQMPLWVFVAAIGVVVLPSLSRHLAVSNEAAVRQDLTQALKFSLIVTIPFSLFLLFMRQPLITVLLQRGAFGSRSVELTATLLLGYAATIPGQAVMVIAFRYFLAVGQIALPVAVTAGVAAINIVLDVFLIRHVGSLGLGIGATVGSTLSATLMMGLIRRSLGFRLSTFGHLWQTIAANVILGALLWGTAAAWSNFRPHFDFGSSIAFLMIITLVGSGLYVALLWRWRVIGRSLGRESFS